VAQDWDNFAVITGSAAAALTGLLFVAVSLIRDRITRHAGLRSQAGQTLVLFALPLLLSVLLVLPGLSAAVLGAGLVLLGLVIGLAMVLIGRGNGPEPAGEGSDDRLARLVDRVSPNMGVVLFLFVGGGLQLAGSDGLYWAAASGTLALIGGMVNAWLFLVRA
jgi:modulator of FtsH protease